MIEFKNIKKKFGNTEVLKGISFKVDEGSVVSLLGSSGCGKTTLLRCFNFLEKPDSGKIYLDSNEFNVEHMTRKDINYIRSHTAMVFQQYNLFRNKTVLENVTEGLIVVKKMNKSDAIKEAEYQLELVGLLEKKELYPSNLSGGQMQRVAIARALALKPSAILFDEPTSALDPELVGEVLEVIKKVAERGITMIIVTHEIQFAIEVSDKIVFLDNGKILEQGSPKDIVFNSNNERINKFFTRYKNNYEYQI